MVGFFRWWGLSTHDGGARRGCGSGGEPVGDRDAAIEVPGREQLGDHSGQRRVVHCGGCGSKDHARRIMT